MQYTSEIFILRRTEKTEKGFQSIMVEIVNSLNFPRSELSIDNSHHSWPFKKNNNKCSMYTSEIIVSRTEKKTRLNRLSVPKG